MTETKPCPCPNLDCPNHGVCEDCTSRHLKIGTLNYCAFYSILPVLDDAVARDPDSPSARAVSDLLERQLGAYAKLMDRHGLTDEERAGLRRRAADHSEH